MTAETSPLPIVILGSGIAGLKTFHTLLHKHLIPSQATGAALPKCIMVSASSEGFFNMAAPRAFVHTTGVEEEKMFVKIVDGLKQYKDSGLAEFVHAKIVRVDVEKQVVVFVRMNEEDEVVGSEEALEFGELVIALGSSQEKGVPWKRFEADGSSVVKQQLRDWREKIAHAQRIVVAGGGATGCEAAAEIKNRYPEKEVTLITSDERLLNIREDIDMTAWKLLESTGVKVHFNTRVKTSHPKADGSIELVLVSPRDNSESTLPADLFVPCWGAHPNNAALPKSILNEQGWVKVDDYLHIQGLTHVWAAGDILPFRWRNAVSLMDQIPILINNIAVQLDLPSLKPTSCSLFGSKQPTLKKYVYNDRPMCAIPIAGAGGTGYMFGFKIPGFVVAAAKKNYMIETHADLVLGTGKV